MKIGTFALVNLGFGAFFLSIGISMFGYANTIGDPSTPSSFSMSMFGLAIMAASLLFLALSLHSFKN